MRLISMKKYTLLIPAILLILALTPALSQKLQTTQWQITSPKLKEAARFAVLSDLHNSFFGKNQEELAGAICDAAPDAVLMVGDMAENPKTMDGVQTLIRSLKGGFTIYYVSGNHECADADALNNIKQMLRQMGVNVLEGKRAFLREDLYISGADDPLCCTKEEWLRQIDACRTEDEGFTLLLSHRPDRIAAYSRGFDLTICGHAHGGQIRFGNHGLIAPNQGLFPKYTSGFYEAGEGKMFVSRGLAKGILPRFLNRPELAIIDILPESDF